MYTLRRFTTQVGGGRARTLTPRLAAPAVSPPAKFAVAHQDDTTAIRQVIEPYAARTLSDEAAGRIAATEKLRALYQQTAGKLHIPHGTNDALPTWSDLRDAWYEERLEGEE